MLTSGVYAIVNTVNGKTYIGSAVSLARRKQWHFDMLRRGEHCNGRLQNSFSKHSEGVFKFAVLEEWPPEFLVSMEQWWINMLRPAYNICPVAGSSLGMKHTDRAKAKMRAVKIGYHRSEETRRKIGQANEGKCLSEEHRRKISVAMIGNVSSRGRKTSEETRRKLSEAARGNTRSLGRKWSEEDRRMLSEAQKARYRREREGAA